MTLTMYLYFFFVSCFIKTKAFHVTSIPRHPARVPQLCRNVASTSSSSDFSSVTPRISQSSLQELSTHGYVVINDFLPLDIVKALRDDVVSLRSSNKFKIAKIGQDSTNSLNTEIRVAETCFLGESKLQDIPSHARNKLYEILDMVRIDLSGKSIFDINDVNGELQKAAPALDKSLSELLYAYYPKGGFYRRHVDAVSKSASVLRSYSLLLYLHDKWDENDGGYLRIHLDSGGDFLPQGEEPNFVDVKPEGGTLVLFKSDKIPHEVLDTNAERTAVVGWYNRPYTSADIESLASEGDKVRGMMLLVAAGLVTVGAASIIAG
mmetsp:Transcript_10123/g.12827  ORF Transcript_10123/g.12827 Transcript_10123/m.12827 type:complete len:321 (-) Transcript_10123:47-1009(-)